MNKKQLACSHLSSKEAPKLEALNSTTYYQTTNGEDVNLTSSGTLLLAIASSRKFKHSVEPSFPRLESVKEVKTQSELTSAPACHKKKKCYSKCS
jgi:hypothetical protein